MPYAKAQNAIDGFPIELFSDKEQAYLNKALKEKGQQYNKSNEKLYQVKDKVHKKRYSN